MLRLLSMLIDGFYRPINYFLKLSALISPHEMCVYDVMLYTVSTILFNKLLLSLVGLSLVGLSLSGTL